MKNVRHILSIQISVLAVVSAYSIARAQTKAASGELTFSAVQFDAIQKFLGTSGIDLTPNPGSQVFQTNTTKSSIQGGKVSQTLNRIQPGNRRIVFATVPIDAGRDQSKRDRRALMSPPRRAGWEVRKELDQRGNETGGLIVSSLSQTVNGSVENQSVTTVLRSAAMTSAGRIHQELTCLEDGVESEAGLQCTYADDRVCSRVRRQSEAVFRRQGLTLPKSVLDAVDSCVQDQSPSNNSQCDSYRVAIAKILNPSFERATEVQENRIAHGIALQRLIELNEFKENGEPGGFRFTAPLSRADGVSTVQNGLEWIGLIEDGNSIARRMKLKNSDIAKQLGFSVNPVSGAVDGKAEPKGPSERALLRKFAALVDRCQTWGRDDLDPSAPPIPSSGSRKTDR